MKVRGVGAVGGAVGGEAGGEREVAGGVEGDRGCGTGHVGNVPHEGRDAAEVVEDLANERRVG